MFLPPAYVVRREGNSFTLFVSSHPVGGGVPISHNALQHFPECHGAAGGGYPAMGQPGGGYPARSSRGGTLAGGGYPGWGVPWPRGVPCQRGTQLGQYREYLLHGGRYASCVHAGGLFLVFIILFH